MLSELRFATRGLLRWRWGAVVAVVTLAIGIAATTGLYALVQVILPDLPGVPDLDRLGRVYASSQALGVERSPVALNEFDASLSKATSFAAIGAYAESDATIGSGRDVQPAVAGFATPGFFSALGVAPAAGRVFAASDVEAARPVVILSDALWRRHFPDGRLQNATITVDGVDRAVIGVMPAEFSYGFIGISGQLWIPLGHPTVKTSAIVVVYGRLRDGVGWPAAAAELQALSRGQWTWRAIPVRSDTRQRAMTAYAFMLGPALLVLLISCLNVACLLLARGIDRDKELSVRRALGATRGRVVRLLVTEHALLALIAGTIGAGLAAAILRALSRAIAVIEPTLSSRLTADLGLLPVAFGASVLACLIFGTVPALRLSRRDVAASLNGVPPTHRIEIAGYGARDVIVFAEVASAVGLIVWTAMLYTLFSQMNAITFAFPADHVVVMRVPAAAAGEVVSRVSAIPGVARTTVSSGMLGGGTRVRVETASGVAVMTRMPVGDGFLETLGIPVLRGRAFDAAELHGHGDVAILSESAAQQIAAGGDPVGMQLRVSGRQRLTVIGICRDAIDYGVLSKAAAFAPSELYVPYEPLGDEAVVLARVSVDPHGTLRAIAAAAQTPAGLRSARPVVLSDDMGAKDRNGRGAMFLIRILGAFATVTLLLAATGVFAVINESVAQRTREFGIRLALGAAPRRVLAMVLARETKLIGMAVAVGLVFTMALTRALFVELTSLNAIVPSMWIAALLLSGGVAATAVAFATCRIVRMEPRSGVESFSWTPDVAQNARRSSRWDVRDATGTARSSKRRRCD
jgi:putative ABC transport system permease protein